MKYDVQTLKLTDVLLLFFFLCWNRLFTFLTPVRPPISCVLLFIWRIE